MRDHILYQLGVYKRSPSGKDKDAKLLYEFKDSLRVFGGSLSGLASTMCPELGNKGQLPWEPEEINENIISQENNKKILLEYMVQDIRLLGGIMLKAQNMFWITYKVDITTCLTVSALSMRIFRMMYYDPNTLPIHITSQNQDTFIRRGYYGGHTDVYKPYGRNLFYYDVNSLYPTIMKDCEMPSGKPVWCRNLLNQNVNDLFGFVEAYIICPLHIKKPFLPHRTDSGGLEFPVGEWVDVYFTEELKYAQSIGYTIYPFKGYLFKRKESPFNSFVTDLYAKRREAKSTGDKTTDFIYKILMNSLYGRFGINPISTTTRICEESLNKELVFKKDTFMSSEKLSDRYYIVSYKSNKLGDDDSEWVAPYNSAVYLSAAVTAYSRIHMYPFISRDDAYYTDTDSVVLGSPLPDDVISSTELGKFKLEHLVDLGIFLAPKTYVIEKTTGEKITKAKGAPHDYLINNPEYFKEMYYDPEKVIMVLQKRNFRIDFKSLEIGKKSGYIIIGDLRLNTKRNPIFKTLDDGSKRWVDTEPKYIEDYEAYMNDINKIKYEKKLAEKEALYAKELAEKEVLYAKEEVERKKRKTQLKRKMLLLKKKDALLASKDALIKAKEDEAKAKEATLKEEVEQLRRKLAEKEKALKAKDLAEPLSETTTTTSTPSSDEEGSSGDEDGSSGDGAPSTSETHERETLLIESTFDRDRRIKKEKLNSLLKQNAENIYYLNIKREWLEGSPHKRRKYKTEIQRTKEEIAKARAETDELRQQLEKLEDNHEDTNSDPP